MPVKILLFGFAPFAQHPINPSQQLVEAIVAIDDTTPGDTIPGGGAPFDTIPFGEPGGDGPGSGGPGSGGPGGGAPGGGAPSGGAPGGPTPGGPTAGGPTAPAGTQPASKASGAFDCVGVILPVVLDKALAMASEAIAEHQPQAVVALGLGGGPTIRIERVAVNLADFRIPDQAGDQPIDQSIAADAPAAYWSTLPSRLLLDTLHRHNIPTELSNSAGTYLCNALLYHLLHTAATNRVSTPYLAGFLHVPLLPEMAVAELQQGKMAPPSMSFALMLQGLQIALRTIRMYLTTQMEEPSQSVD